MSLTVCLLNWKRPEYLRRIITALAAQKPRPKIFCWNNSPEFFDHPDLDWVVQGNRNCLFAPRWWMASMAQTSYVCSLDDDLLPRTPRAFADLTEVCGSGTVVGTHGIRWIPGLHYAEQKEGSVLGDDRRVLLQRVNIIKGRCMMMRRTTLEKIPLEALRGEDDINISLYLSTREEADLIALPQPDNFEDLATGDESYCQAPGHNDRRQAAVEYWRPDWAVKEGGAS